MSANTIENLTLAAIKICVSSIETITFLPGFNFVTDRQLVVLQSHPAYQAKLSRGILRVKDLTEEIKHDDRTNLPYVETKGEQVPVSNALVNGKTSAVLDNGHRFRLDELIDKGFDPNLAGRIVKFTPSEGWIDANHITEACNVEEPDRVSQIQKLFA